MFNKRLLVLCILTTGIYYPLSAFSENKIRQEGNLIIDNIPEIPVSIDESLFPYQNTRSATFSDWLTDGKRMLINTRFSESNQVHLLEMPGGARKQITFFNEPVNQATVCPNTKFNGFIFTKDKNGNENFQIYYFDFKTGKFKILTDGKSRNEINSWSFEGDKFAFSSNKRNGRDMDIFISDMKNPEKAVPVLEKGGSWSAGHWSRDGKKIIISRYVSANENYLYILNPATKELTEINPSVEKISHGGAVWSFDNKGIFFTSDEKSDFKHLKYYDLKTKKSKKVILNKNWNIDGFTISKTGKYLLYSVNEGGISKLRLLNSKSMKEINLPKLPEGIITAYKFNKDDSNLAFSVNTSQLPGDVYTINLKSQKVIRWTFSELGGLPESIFVKPDLIHYPTFDKVNGKTRMIPAFYFKPNKKKEGKTPVLIQIHGGPESQYRPYFSPIIQYYLNEMGIALIAPNVRGSDGYGKNYLLLDNGFKREDSVKDIGSLLDWIARQPELDSGRVAVTGTSYGGYMVLSCMAHFNNRLRAGIDSVGISNFVTFLKNTGAYRQDLRRPEYGDERIPEMKEFLERISPTNNAHKISKNMLIVQGENDPRVPVTEAEQIVRAIRENGTTVWYLLGKDEGHGFSKKSNTNFLNKATVLFLQENLLK